MTNWRPTLKTDAPEKGCDLAGKLSRVAVKLTQTDVRERLRPDYAEDPDALIAVCQVIATRFATVADAKGYWQDKAWAPARCALSRCAA